MTKQHRSALLPQSPSPPKNFPQTLHTANSTILSSLPGSCGSSALPAGKSNRPWCWKSCRLNVKFPPVRWKPVPSLLRGCLTAHRPAPPRTAPQRCCSCCCCRCCCSQTEGGSADCNVSVSPAFCIPFPPSQRPASSHSFCLLITGSSMEKGHSEPPGYPRCPFGHAPYRPRKPKLDSELCFQHHGQHLRTKTAA